MRFRNDLWSELIQLFEKQRILINIKITNVNYNRTEYLKNDYLNNASSCSNLALVYLNKRVIFLDVVPLFGYQT